VLPNKEKIRREWLIYSTKLNSVFCYPCRIFGKPENSSALTSQSGYNDWKHLSTTLVRHEKSSLHFKNITTWLELRNKLKLNLTIDKHQQTLYQIEQRRWRLIIDRVIAIIKFLATQCLAFKGESDKLVEQNNGNFLKAVEMISKFDPVLMEHVSNIKKSTISNTHMPHYLSPTIQNKIICLLGKAIKTHIIKEIKQAKYFSIILDTTDANHVEQMTCVIRFVNVINCKVQICERFLDFFPLLNTTGDFFQLCDKDFIA
jgi:hypothetical protein